MTEKKNKELDAAKKELSNLGYQIAINLTDIKNAFKPQKLMQEQSTYPQNEQQADILNKIEQGIKQRNRHRVISFALFESAMRYRESFYREDIEDFEEGLISEIENYAGKKDKGWDKRARKKIESLVINYKNEQERFNTQMYAHIKKLTDALTGKSNSGFDNYSTAFGLLSEELEKAKNTTELLIVAQAYNMGILDSFLEKVKEAQVEKEEDRDVPVGDKNAGELVAEQETPKPSDDSPYSDV